MDGRDEYKKHKVRVKRRTVATAFAARKLPRHGRGDGGQTHLPALGRTAKCHPRLEACGALDELLCAIGEVAARIEASSLEAAPRRALLRHLRRIQGELLQLGGLVSGATDHTRRSRATAPAMVRQLENEIEEMEACLPACQGFVLPGGNLPASAAHIARAICRRAERDCVAALGDDASAPTVLPYLNRLGAWLFALARWLTEQLGNRERYWRGPARLRRSRRSR